MLMKLNEQPGFVVKFYWNSNLNYCAYFMSFFIQQMLRFIVIYEFIRARVILRGIFRCQKSDKKYILWRALLLSSLSRVNLNQTHSLSSQRPPRDCAWTIKKQRREHAFNPACTAELSKQSNSCRVCGYVRENPIYKNASQWHEGRRRAALITT